MSKRLSGILFGSAGISLMAMHGRGFHFDKPDPENPNNPATKGDAETLAEEAARLQTEGRQMFSTAKAEKRGLTDDEQKEQDKRFSRLETIKKLLDEETKFAKVAFDAATIKTDDGDIAGDQGGNVTMPKEPGGRGAVAKFDGKSAEQRQEFCVAVDHWAASGEMNRKFATVTTATQNSVYLPRQIAAAVLPSTSNSIRDAINIQNMGPVSLVTTPTTADMKVPVVIGSAGGVVAENAGAETENVPSLSESITLNVQTYQSGSVYYSNQVLAAGTVDVVNAVIPTLRYEKELGLEAAVVAGIVADAGITKVVRLAGIVEAGLTYPKLVELNRALPKRFDVKKVILLSDDAYAAAEKMVDTTGQPVLNRDPQNQELLRFAGTPVIRCSYLEAFGDDKCIGVCIGLLGFRLRDAADEALARYTQVPSKPNQVGFNIFAYHGFGYAPSAMAKLKCADV